MPATATTAPVEYEAARAGAAIIARDDRAFIRVFGREPVKMIHGLVTNEVAGAAPDRAVYALLLTPKGKMLADLRVIRREDDVLLEVPVGALDNVTTTLKKFVPPLFARFEVTDTVAELSVYGPQAAALLGEALGGPLPETMAEDDIVEGDVSGGRTYVIRSGYTDVEGYDVVARPAALATLRDRLTAAGAVPISATTLEVLRIEAGRPRWGAELDENVIPLEARLDARAISRTKGCYTGQEVIIRILHRGHVNWLLRGVLTEVAPPEHEATARERAGTPPAMSATLPAKDTALLRPEDGRKVGRVTSACFSPRHGRIIALAYTRRELEPPVTLKLDRIDGDDVVVTDLPFAAAPLTEA